MNYFWSNKLNFLKIKCRLYTLKFKCNVNENNLAHGSFDKRNHFITLKLLFYFLTNLQESGCYILLQLYNFYDNKTLWKLIILFASSFNTFPLMRNYLNISGCCYVKDKMFFQFSQCIINQFQVIIKLLALY